MTNVYIFSVKIRCLIYKDYLLFKPLFTDDLFNLPRVVKEQQSFFSPIELRPRVAVDLETRHAAGREVEDVFGNRIGEIGNPVVVGEKSYGIHIIVQVIDHRFEIAFRRIIKFLIRHHVDVVRLVENFAGIQSTHRRARDKIVDGDLIVFHKAGHLRGFF